MSKEKLILNEDLATPADPNIETTDQNLSVDSIFQQTNIPSLAREICAITVSALHKLNEEMLYKFKVLV